MTNTSVTAVTGTAASTDSFRTLIIVRGLPGSGKSTIAAKLSGDTLPFCTDDELEGKAFSTEALKAAHALQKAKLTVSLATNEYGVVDGMFANANDIEKYIEPVLALVGKENLGVLIVECTGNFTPKHPVPEKALNAIKRRWTPGNECIQKLKEKFDGLEIDYITK